MATPRTESVALFGARALNNSAAGNPRWKLHTSEGDYLTQSDASVNYDVNNILRTHQHTETNPCTVTLHLTRAGRVSDITRNV